MNLAKNLRFVFAGLVCFLGVGCNSYGYGVNGSQSSTADHLPRQPNSSANTSTSTSGAGGSKSSTCAGDSTRTCIALKYVAYENENKQPVLTQAEAQQNVENMNQIWDQCKIQFQIDEFVQTNLEGLHLNYSPSDSNEMYDIRKSFADDKTLLIVTTGDWNRAGSLGSTGANAWTSMPGDSAYGAVLEKPVATFSNIIAHEIGHYLNLDHLDDSNSLMSPMIGDYSKTLNASECETANEAISHYWEKMKR